MSTPTYRPVRPALGWPLAWCLNMLFVLDHFLTRRVVDAMLGRFRRAAHRAVRDRLAARGPGRFVPVAEVTDLDPAAFVREHIKPGVPVVFRGCGAHWPATTTWSPEHFKARYGNDEALLVFHEAYDGFAPHDGDAKYERTTLGAVIDALDDGTQRYARFHPLLDRHPELQDDLAHGWLDDKMAERTADGFVFHALFLGPDASRTPIHNAGNENLFFQAYGHKRWRLWGADARYVFDPEANRAPAKSSPLDPDAPDLTTHPAYAFLDGYETVLGPGDVLYVPAYAWHHVENRGATIGVATRWTSVRNNLRRAATLFALEFLNTRPNIVATMFPRGEFDFNRFLIRGAGYTEADAKVTSRQTPTAAPLRNGAAGSPR